MSIFNVLWELTRKHTPFSDLVGKTLTAIDVTKDALKEDDHIVFVCETGEKYVQYHEQDCCEGVSIEDIVGEISDLIGSPILQAEESSNGSETDDGDEQWTFYKLATVNGYVTIRWYGSSNGYYSTSVSFMKMEPEQKEEATEATPDESTITPTA